MKAVHIDTAIAWAAALLLIVLLGDRRGLLRAVREIDSFDADDRRWLKGQRAPQGRFNAGQKLNVVLTAAFALLFASPASSFGTGERDTHFRFASTLVVHDGSFISRSSCLSGISTWPSSTRRRATPCAG